ncbi:MAG: hypothetical protein N2037_04825 [Acidimicrobiales bacterium]|nr:hypothetical protein [Acidimicrobiales bacterium]
MAETRKAIHAYLSPEAHDAWHEFAAEHGVSVSGLLEALGLEWHEQLEADKLDSSRYESLTKSARKIDSQRRRRKRG